MAAALFDAIARGDVPAVAALLAAGADTGAAGPHGWRPLHAAVDLLEDGGPVETMVLLLRHGAAVDAWDANGEATPLLMALFRGQHDAARLLLAAGADPNVVGAEGDSPLRWCVERGDLRMAALLLACGAGRTIDGSGGAQGWTALGAASSQLDAAMVALLLRAGADPHARDADRRTARDRLPPRERADPDRWDRLAALLADASGAGSGGG